MKKILFLTLIFSAIVSTTIQAQSGSGPSVTSQPATAKLNEAPAGVDWAAMLKQAKQTQKAPMIEKTGLSDAQVDRIIEINFEIRQQAMTALAGLNEADRAAKLAELKVAKEQKYSAIPLTPEQIKTVYTYYEDMGKNMQPKAGN